MDKGLLVILLLVIVLIGYSVSEEYKFAKGCDRLGGQTVKTYRHSFICVKDPNILKVK